MMMNLFELEYEMKERQLEVERTARFSWAARISMLDWAIGAAALGMIGIL